MTRIRMLNTISLLLSVSLLTATLVTASPEPVVGGGKGAELEKSYYRRDDPVVFECLNRTIDTGEHVQDSHGHLQYLPFFTCLESSTPLTLPFLSTSQINCTIPSLSEHLFHLFEFYIHADSPFSCRVPSRPRTWGARNIEGEDASQGGAEDGTEWVPVVLSLAGSIELSHVHIATDMNLIFHLSDSSHGKGSIRKPEISAGTAYSTKPLTGARRIKIGDALPLRFSVRWYETEELPESNLVVEEAGWGTSWVVLAAVMGAAVGAWGGLRWGGGRKGEVLPRWSGEGGGRGGGWGKAD